MELTLWNTLKNWMRTSPVYCKCVTRKVSLILCITCSLSVVYFGGGLVIWRRLYSLYPSNVSPRLSPTQLRKDTTPMKYELTTAGQNMTGHLAGASASGNPSMTAEAIKTKMKKYKMRTHFKFIGAPISGNLTMAKVGSQQKVVLLWNDYSEGSEFISDEHFRECKIQGFDRVELPCRVTKRREDLSQSDAIVVYVRFMTGIPALPRQLLPHQHLVLLYAESPKYLAVDLTKSHGVFNSTASYRLDSDYITSYGKATPKVTPLDEEDFRKIFTRIMSEKKKLAVARISNCRAKHRIDYIHQLQKYIPVDFIGRCGNTPCEETRQYRKCKENDELIRQYSFHLSFENNFCRDYITEKFWLPLAQWSSIPVVMGGESPLDYMAVAPPGSYINTADFDSPKRLAQYLLLVYGNQTLYEEYFYWRKSYEAATHQFDWCSLCSDLHNVSRPFQYYKDLQGWFEQDVCRN